MKYTPLNQRGFSYHIILPVLTMLAVSVIGIYTAEPTWFLISYYSAITSKLCLSRAAVRLPK
jgi:hypothetical protein